MKRLKVIIFSLSTVFFYYSNAQILDFSSEELRRSSITNVEETKGSPYVNENFMPLRIKGYDQIFSGRFNAYNGEMEVKVEDKTIVLDIQKPYEVTFTSTNTTYKIFNYTNADGNRKNKFLAIVSESPEFSLLKEESIKYEEAAPAKSSYQPAKPASFKKENDSYYLAWKDKIIYLPSRRKDFVALFPEKDNKINDFIKSNKISLSKEEDLLKITNFITSL
jgi:hypothetical protein